MSARYYFVRLVVDEYDDPTMNVDLIVRAESYEQAAELWFSHYEFEDDVVEPDEGEPPQEWVCSVCLIPELPSVGACDWGDIDGTSRTLVLDIRGQATCNITVKA